MTKRGLVRAGRVDARHLSFLLFGPVTGAIGLIAAGAPAIAIAVSAFIGLVVFGVMAVLVFPPWTGPKRGTFLAGAMYLAITAIALIVSLIIRHHQAH